MTDKNSLNAVWAICASGILVGLGIWYFGGPDSSYDGSHAVVEERQNTGQQSPGDATGGSTEQSNGINRVAQPVSVSYHKAVSVRVLSAINNRPLEAVLVGGSICRKTDSMTGRAILSVTDRKAKYTCVAKGFVNRDFVVPSEPEGELILKMTPAATLTCVVVDSGGNRVSDAELLVCTKGGEIVVGKTGMDGSLLVSIEKGSIVYARKSEYATGFHMWAGEPGLVMLRLFQENCRTIGVRDAKTKDPIVGAEILLDGLGYWNGVSLAGKCDKKGLIDVAVPPGSYTVTVQALGVYPKGSERSRQRKVEAGSRKWIEVHREIGFPLKVNGYDFRPGTRVRSWIEVKESPVGKLSRVQFGESELLAVDGNTLDLSPIVMLGQSNDKLKLMPHTLCIQTDKQGVYRIRDILKLIDGRRSYSVYFDKNNLRWIRIVDSAGLPMRAKLSVRLSDIFIGGDDFVGMTNSDGWLGPFYWIEGGVTIGYGRSGKPLSDETITAVELKANSKIDRQVKAGCITIDMKGVKDIGQALLDLRCYALDDPSVYLVPRSEHKTSVEFPILCPGKYMVGTSYDNMVEVLVPVPGKVNLNWKHRWNVRGVIEGRILGDLNFVNERIAIVPVFRDARQYALTPELAVIPVSITGRYSLAQVPRARLAGLAGILVVKEVVPGRWLPLRFEDGCPPKIKKLELKGLVAKVSPDLVGRTVLEIESVAGGFSARVQYVLHPGGQEDLGLWPAAGVRAYRWAKRIKSRIDILPNRGSRVMFIR